MSTLTSLFDLHLSDERNYLLGTIMSHISYEFEEAEHYDMIKEKIQKSLKHMSVGVSERHSAIFIRFPNYTVKGFDVSEIDRIIDGTEAGIRDVIDFLVCNKTEKEYDVDVEFLDIMNIHGMLALKHECYATTKFNHIKRQVAVRIMMLTGEALSDILEGSYTSENLNDITKLEGQEIVKYIGVNKIRSIAEWSLGTLRKKVREYKSKIVQPDDDDENAEQLEVDQMKLLDVIKSFQQKSETVEVEGEDIRFYRKYDDNADYPTIVATDMKKFTPVVRQTKPGKFWKKGQVKVKQNPRLILTSDKVNVSLQAKLKLTSRNDLSRIIDTKDETEVIPVGNAPVKTKKWKEVSKIHKNAINIKHFEDYEIMYEESAISNDVDSFTVVGKTAFKGSYLGFCYATEETTLHVVVRSKRDGFKTHAINYEGSRISIGNRIAIQRNNVMIKWTEYSSEVDKWHRAICDWSEVEEYYKQMSIRGTVAGIGTPLRNAKDDGCVNLLLPESCISERTGINESSLLYNKMFNLAHLDVSMKNAVTVMIPDTKVSNEILIEIDVISRKVRPKLYVKRSNFTQKGVMNAILDIPRDQKTDLDKETFYQYYLYSATQGLKFVKIRPREALNETSNPILDEEGNPEFDLGKIARYMLKVTNLEEGHFRFFSNGIEFVGKVHYRTSVRPVVFRNTASNEFVKVKF